MNNENILVCDAAAKYNPYTFYDDCIHELSEIKFVYNLCRSKIKKSLIINVGSQSGSFCLFAKFIKHEFLALEADPTSHNCLKENLEINNITNVRTKNTLILDRIGIETFNVFPTHTGLNHAGSEFIRIEKKYSKQISMPCETLDSLLNSSKNYLPIYLLIIDCEGAELKILQGAKELINENRPLIFLEWNEQNLKQFGHSTSELEELLESLNYKKFVTLGENRLYYRRMGLGLLYARILKYFKFFEN